eukprot:264957_1
MGNTASENDFSEQYKLGSHIARGTFATVKHCTRRSDNLAFAVKIVTRSELTCREWELVQDEIYILKLLTDNAYPNVVHLEHVFQDTEKIIMILELCQTQTLLDRMYASRNNRFSELECAHITFAIAKTLKYLHTNHIVHRDLKPENILFAPDGTLKITDFGSAKYVNYKSTNDVKEGEQTKKRLVKMRTMIGTPNYVAPEVICNAHQGYSSKVDLWSLGVMVYQMLCGYLPFTTRRSIDRLYKDILNGNYSLSSSIWEDISDDAIDLVKGLLCVDADQRLSVDEVLNHKWILKYNGNIRCVVSTACQFK